VNTVVALGEERELEGFALVGVTVVAARTAEAQRQAWSELGTDVGLVILSPAASEALGERLADRPDVLTVVTP
jgi:vacuolar-type H+-ATPase subunit F/Vma7